MPKVHTVPLSNYAAPVLLATWNVNSLKARMPRVEEWLEATQPDVVCMQETKMADDAFPTSVFADLGYASAHHGEGRWNGVAILSRVGLEDPAAGFEDADPPDPDARLVSATCGGVRVSSVYVPNGRALDDDHYQYKLAWLDRLSRQLDTNHSPTDKVVVAGDFNIAPDDRDVYSTSAFNESTHVSVPEREALARMQKWGLSDVFRDRYPDDELYSYWDYRSGMFHTHRGMRIDLILATEPVASTCEFALVDRNARKGTKPSDHAPVLADFLVGT